MSPEPHLRDLFGYGRRPGSFSTWAMSIVFATVAVVSFAVDQTVSLSASAEAQGEVSPPSLLHPVQLIESLIDAASE